MSNKAIREALEALMNAGVIKKSAKSDDIRRILEQAQGTTTPRFNPSEVLFGKPGGVRRTFLNPALGVAGGTGIGVGLERLLGDTPASSPAPSGSGRFMESLGEEQAFRQYVDSENYRRSNLRGQGMLLHFLSGQKGEYVPPNELLPLNADEMLQRSAILKNAKAEEFSRRTRAEAAQQSVGKVAEIREQQTAETQRRALDLLQQIYGTSRQAPAPLSQDQLDQPYQY